MHSQWQQYIKSERTNLRKRNVVLTANTSKSRDKKHREITFLLSVCVCDCCGACCDKCNSYWEILNRYHTQFVGCGYHVFAFLSDVFVFKITKKEEMNSEMYDKWNVCVWGCLFRIWLTLIDFFIECKCLSHIMITTTIQRSWMKQKTETAFFALHQNQPAIIYSFIETFAPQRNKTIYLKMSSVTLLH